MTARKRGCLSRRGRATRYGIQTKAGGCWLGPASAGSRSRQQGFVFQRMLSNAHVFTDERGTGRGIAGRGSDDPIGSARGLC